MSTSNRSPSLEPKTQVARVVRVLAAGWQWLAERLPIWRWTTVFFRTSFLPEQNYLIILAVVVGAGPAPATATTATAFGATCF